MNDSGRGRLVTVSNRLPIVVRKKGEEWSIKKGAGGLVTALVPVLEDRGGVWIGWPGVVEEDAQGFAEAFEQRAGKPGFDLKTVMLTREEHDNFYYGFSNEIAWPMFHDLQILCNFDPRYWNTYRSVNRKFADVIVSNLDSKDILWIHDYHLMCTATELRSMGVDAALLFFLHIPFPSPDIFFCLPWRLRILESLLDYDFLGFQTRRDQRNFLNCVERLAPDVSLESQGRITNLTWKNRRVRTGYFPISIDFEAFEEKSQSEESAEAAWLIHEKFPERKIILGVDRLDYTKGIPYRLEAFQTALQKYPELIEARTSLVQIVVPSRQNLPAYVRLREEVERLVGQINGEFTRAGWIPVHYQYRTLDQTVLTAYYRTAEVALVTPIKDGMNLVCKEYCACNLEENGVLILSEFAGAADQLQDGALLVNPFDREGTADAIYQALTMDRQERRTRMRHLRQTVKKEDIFWWVDSFLQAAVEKDLSFYPLLQEYTPQIEL